MDGIAVFKKKKIYIWYLRISTEVLYNQEGGLSGV